MKKIYWIKSAKMWLNSANMKSLGLILSLAVVVSAVRVQQAGKTKPIPLRGRF